MSAELEEALTALRARGTVPKRAGEGWTAKCPAHDDSTASLSLRAGDSKPLIMNCHAGCDHASIKAALGIPDRKPPGTASKAHVPPASPAPRPTIVATYPYTDEHGEVLYEAVRYEPKTFRQRRPNGEGGWTHTLGDVRLVLYQLPLVLNAAGNGGVVYIAEGEKDVHAIHEHTLEVATCSPMGAGKWRDHYADALTGASAIVIIADKDAPGYKHAETIAASLTTRSIPHVIRHALTGKDAHDHLAAGHTLDELVDYEPVADADVGETLDSDPADEPDAAETADTPRARVQLLDLDDLLRNPPPPPDWAWDGYIERGTPAVLHGDGGLGKSLIGMGLCRRYTLGKEWMGRGTKGGTALYLDGENSLREIARRLYAFEVRPGEKLIHYGRVEMPILLDPIAGEELLTSLIEDTGADLVVLDSQRALWGADENETTNVRPMYAMLARVAERLNTAILLIHHDNKGGVYSGSTDVNAATISRLHLERKSKNRKDRKRVLWHEKSRSDTELDEVTFSIDKTPDGRFTFQIHDSDDDGTEAPMPSIKRDTTRERILSLLADRVPRSRPEVARELGFDVSSQTLRRAWADLTEDGTLGSSDGRNWGLAEGLSTP